MPKMSNLFVVCNANETVTSDELIRLADIIEGCWQQFASVLEPDLFNVTGKIAAIKNDYPSSALQAKAMLEIWCKHLGAKAQRHLLIGALIQRRQRSDAEAVFGVEVVEEMLKSQEQVAGQTDEVLP